MSIYSYCARCNAPIINLNVGYICCSRCQKMYCPACLKKDPALIVTCLDDDDYPLEVCRTCYNADPSYERL